jgi:hypothetical protein
MSHVQSTLGQLTTTTGQTVYPVGRTAPQSTAASLRGRIYVKQDESQHNPLLDENGEILPPSVLEQQYGNAGEVTVSPGGFAEFNVEWPYAAESEPVILYHVVVFEDVS